MANLMFAYFLRRQNEGGKEEGQRDNPVPPESLPFWGSITNSATLNLESQNAPDVLVQPLILQVRRQALREETPDL